MTAEIVFVIGGPGAGKGTQCQMISKQFNYVHLSIGDLLRSEMKSGSSDGLKIRNLINEGKLVPIDIVMKVLKNAMKNSPSNKFLLDGFPRNFENIKGWVEAFGDNQSVKIKFVLFFDCPESEMERRLLKRGKTSGREDDNAHVIKKRFQTFMTETLPIIEYYQKNSLLKTVQAIGTQEQVFARVVEHFAKSAL